MPEFNDTSTKEEKSQSVEKRIRKEINRLRKLYKPLPENQFALVEGLIVQAARLRVRLDDLWADIQENGETELFNQSEKTEPYERRRPVAELFTATDKNYQAIIKLLDEKLPSSISSGKSRLGALRDK